MPSLNALSRRQRMPEVMDQPGIDPADHARALVGLRRINALSRCSASLFAPIAALAERQPGQPLRVLDLACGGGDTVIDLVLLARRSKLPLIPEGAAPAGYDVVITSLFLHHLGAHDAEVLLALMASRARHLVLVNDLIRSPLGDGRSGQAERRQDPALLAGALPAELVPWLNGSRASPGTCWGSGPGPLAPWPAWIWPVAV